MFSGCKAKEEELSSSFYSSSSLKSFPVTGESISHVSSAQTFFLFPLLLSVFAFSHLSISSIQDSHWLDNEVCGLPLCSLTHRAGRALQVHYEGCYRNTTDRPVCYRLLRFCSSADRNTTTSDKPASCSTSDFDAIDAPTLQMQIYCSDFLVSC